jgi:hypothetical protein
MKKTYQPFIILKADEILEILKEDVKYSDFIKNRLCDLLTDKFINGKLCSEDPIEDIFNEDELVGFISEALTYDSIKHLMELELVNSFNDGNNEDCFFLTEKGKLYVETMIKKK